MSLEKHHHFLRILNKGIVDEAGVATRSHLGQDPIVEPTAKSLVKTSFVVPDSSVLRGATEGFPAVTAVRAGDKAFSTLEDSYLAAHSACTETVSVIAQSCRKTGKKFFDHSFYFDSQENLYPEGTPSDSDVAEPTVIKRVSEVFPGQPLFAGKTPTCTAVQGAIGDGFLIQSLTAIQTLGLNANGDSSSTPVDDQLGGPDTQHPLLRNFAAWDAEVGVYGVLFFVNGAWTWVIVDDLIAVDGGGRRPLFACSSGVETWPMLLEKAYAKLHGNWDLIDGGWPTEAFVTLTGGVATSIAVDKMTLEDFNSTFVANPSVKSVVTCSTEVAEEDSLSEHVDRFRGLFAGGMYTVIRCKVTGDGKGFVRVRNHFGVDGEWSGPYSDNAKEWDKNVLHRMELQPQKKDDRGFWMQWRDFCAMFPRPTVCEIPRFASRAAVFWSATWTDTAPQQAFLLKVNGDKPVSIWLQLGQRDPKIGNANHAAAKTLPYVRQRLNVYELSKVPRKRSEFLGAVQRMLPPADFAAERTVDRKLLLEPGTYCISPEFALPDGADATTVEYFVREFHASQARVEVSHIADDISAQALCRSSSPSTPVRMSVSDKLPGTVPAGAATSVVAGGGARGVMDLRNRKHSDAAQPATPTSPYASRNAGTASAAGAPAITFTNSGGFNACVQTAFALADPWQRGRIDRRMAEQAFAQLLMHSDIGLAFSSGAAEAAPLDQQAFTELVKRAIKGDA